MDRKPALVAETVQEFVGNAHGNLQRVEELLTEQPALINASWDWGGGDWETALGAAAHMGRVDIATYLLEQGARPDLFAAAMLGQIAVVSAIVGAWPAARTLRGPHGITLLAHARAGGEGATAVVAYLETLEGADAVPA